MAVVTGTLTDVGGGHLAGKNPEIIFTLNAPNVNGATIHPTEPVSVIPDWSGVFSTYLAATTGMRGDAWYSMQIRWLNSGDSFSVVDFPDWKIRVPGEGGPIGDLIGGLFPSAIVIKSPTPPSKWFGLATLWLQMDPSDPNNAFNPANTGNLYELRNV